MFHRYGLFRESFSDGVPVALAYFELHEIGGIDARITRRAEVAFGVVDGLAERGERDVA
jgi:hypothetical protein